MDEPTYYRWTFKVFFRLNENEEDRHLLSNIFVEMMVKRYSVYYTEEAFEKARRAAARLGIILDDIERWPIVEPEFIPKIREECLLDEPDEYDLAEIDDTNYLKDSKMEYDWRDYRKTHHDFEHEPFM